MFSPSRPERFVAAAWVGMVAAAVLFVFRFSTNCPFWDEWDMLKPLTGQQPLGPWLLEFHNEHRLPLPRLLWWAVVMAAGRDFRAPCYVNVAALGVLALAFIFAARRLRGRTVVADAFFPVVLLNWSHSENFLLSYQLTFVCSVALVGALLLAVLRCGPTLPWRPLLAAIVCLLLLPLCGAHGLAYVPPGALWLGYLAVRAGRDGAWGKAVVLCAGSWTALGLVGLYFHGYQKPTYHPEHGDPTTTGQVLLQYLALQFGWAGARAWPLSAVAAVALPLATALLLAAGWRANPDDRPRAVGLAAIAVGGLALALGIAWGRSGFPDATGFVPRYALLAAPLAGVAYFAAVLAADRRVAGRVPLALLFLGVVLLVPNNRGGLLDGQVRRAKTAAFAADLAAGLPLDELARRNAGRVYPVREVLLMRFGQLRDAGVEPYRHLPLTATACPAAPLPPTTMETPPAPGE